MLEWLFCVRPESPPAGYGPKKGLGDRPLTKSGTAMLVRRHQRQGRSPLGVLSVDWAWL